MLDQFRNEHGNFHFRKSGSYYLICSFIGGDYDEIYLGKSKKQALSIWEEIKTAYLLG